MEHRIDDPRILHITHINRDERVMAQSPTTVPELSADRAQKRAVREAYHAYKHAAGRALGCKNRHERRLKAKQTQGEK